jgi:hypothetical protein
VLCYVESLWSWLLSIWFEIPRDFGDYQGYMGSSLRIWSLRRLFLDLCSYNLDGSMTAGIGARFNVNISFVYLNKSFVKNLNSNLKSVSGHILYAQIRTIRWLIKVLTWGFLIVFLFRCPYGVLLYGCHLLGGNVWIKIPLRPGKWELWEHDRPTVDLGESSCGYSHIYMFNHVSMRVLNYGYICRVALILKYIHRGIYVWKVFSLLLFLCVILGTIGLKCNFLQVH